MERIPNTPHTLVYTGDGLASLPVLLASTIPQHLRLFSHSLVLQILYAYRPLRAVDVMCDDDWVSPWPWAYSDLDLWAIASKGWKRGFYERVHSA
jgi:hypothetical protein